MGIGLPLNDVNEKNLSLKETTIDYFLIDPNHDMMVKNQDKTNLTIQTVVNFYEIQITKLGNADKTVVLK